MEVKTAMAVKYLMMFDTVATQAPHEAGQEDYASCLTNAVTMRMYTAEDPNGDPKSILVLPRTVVIEAGHPPLEA